MKDNFSRQADLYARYRPHYPKELFDFIIGYVKNKELAWDCGTGNGQTAMELAKCFDKVLATDISQNQIEKAPRAGNIYYSVQPAEQTDFPDNTVDLVAVSQAVHWFRFENFYNEVKRVARPGGWIAVWMYSLPIISPEIDQLVNVEHYKNILGPWWDYERKYVDDNYTSLPFPFRETETPPFQIDFQWTLEELEGYLNTWSALQKFIKEKQFNPVDELIKKIRPHWSAETSSEENERMKITFPIHLRLGEIKK